MSAADKKSVVGVFIDVVDLPTATEKVIEAARLRQGFAVSAMAVHGIMEGVLDPAHLYRINHLELVVADGQPVRWELNHLHSVGLRERVSGPMLTLKVLARAEQEKMPVYFYGSTQDVLALLCEKLKRLFP